MGYKEDILEWAKYVSIPQKAIGGFPVCPFAKNAAPFDIVVTDVDNIVPPDITVELVIFLIPITTPIEVALAACDRLKEQYSDFAFLLDYHSKETFINGARTNNGKHNLILCQNRAKLSEAREKLVKTDYYSYWDAMYLSEIMSA